ncbi:hypothetical protein [Marinobacter sp.]|uniref:hypothetical protein n=1 Tax=Marinobacter sp. TaxID=50741 RepID=UPI0019A6EDAF|nr:hypothetical protein [Marinobacter sp.]MBD3655940.1 hypothetical protein [Marinobacter sp.]
MLRALIAAGLTSGLAACGGGSSSGTANTQDQANNDAEAKVVTGTFVDSPVGGLEYETTSGLSGLTNDAGEFTYQEGETVSFRIGAFNIGSSAGADVVSPFTLTANDQAKAANIARFLQTLDDDGVPGNGITISDSTRVKAANQNPTDVATANLDDSTVGNIVTALTVDNSVPQTLIVSAENALEHLNGTLATLNPVASCAEGGEALTSSRIEDKAFGFIKSDEILIFQFAAGGTLTEYHYDKVNGGAITDGAEGTWALTGNTLTLDGNEAFTACATDTSVLLETGEEVATLFDVKPYSRPASAESFMLSYDGVNQAILTVKSDGSLDYFPAETPISAASKGTANTTTGALDLDFDEAGVIDQIFFLAGQGKRTGIYLDRNEAGDLAKIGVATRVPDTRAVSAATFSGKTFVYRDDAKNEIVIVSYNADGSFEDFNNDCYVDGQQNACYSVGGWSWNSEFELLEEVYSEFDSTPFKVADSGSKLYLAEQTVEGGSIFEVQQTRAITETFFTGSYTVDIPTENTRFNQLVIGESGLCTYAGVECSWLIDDSGKAVISFKGDATTKGNIWQLAGSSSQYAFVMTHSDNANDIEPGLMTRD